MALRPKAWAPLRYLAERPGTLVTKDELHAAVWGDAVVSDEHVDGHAGGAAPGAARQRQDAAHHRDRAPTYLERRFHGARVADDVAAVVHAHTDGNPLFMIVLVDHLLARGWLTEDGGGDVSVATCRLPSR